MAPPVAGGAPRRSARVTRPLPGGPAPQRLPPPRRVPRNHLPPAPDELRL
eukprot:gene54183-61031_t